MKVFITGGTGNMGQYVSIACAERGYDVTVLSRNPERYSGLSNNYDINIVQGFINDRSRMRKYIKGCDAVIHIALGWGTEPITMCMEDTVAAVNLLETAEKSGAEKFIYTSSTAVLGHYEHNMNENTVISPAGLYGSTKAASEAYVLGFKEYGAEYGTNGEQVTMKRNIIRPGYTFSNPPYEDAPSQLDGRFRDITDAVVKGQPIQLIQNDGTQFISARQIAKVFIALLESDYNEEIFYALSNTFISWERIAKIAMEEFPHSKAVIELYDGGYGDDPMMFNVSKMNNLLGLKFTGEDEVRKHIRWNLEQSIKKYKV